MSYDSGRVCSTWRHTPHERLTHQTPRRGGPGRGNNRKRPPTSTSPHLAEEEDDIEAQAPPPATSPAPRPRGGRCRQCLGCGMGKLMWLLVLLSLGLNLAQLLMWSKLETHKEWVRRTATAVRRRASHVGAGLAALPFHTPLCVHVHVP
mmetsp:Transcript_46155/g.154018  ORF Transcript_46155/g.154018 Transcript_46155/m.154018 type:complete len:149 (-) Transcript_46155:859-1305(-)